MTYGFQIKRANGAIQFDSSDVDIQMILAVDILSIAANQGYSQSYLDFVGRQLQLTPISGAETTSPPDGESVAITYPGGIPTLNIGARAYEQHFLLMVL